MNELLIYAAEQLLWSPSSSRRRGLWLFSFKCASGISAFKKKIKKKNNKERSTVNFGSLIGQRKNFKDWKNDKYDVRYEHHVIYNCWDAVLWLDYWKRTVIYTILAILLFAQPHRAWFTTVGGLMLIALGLLHAVRWYNNLKSHPMSLLEQQENG